MMRWIYRLQQRIAITRGECNLILGLAFLFCLGLAARYVQSRARPLPDVDYAAVERAFEQASEARPAAPADTSVADRTAYGPKQALPGAPVDLNTATAADLQRLPRIGPTLAARIIAYREAHGPFGRVQDLGRVRGIGKKTLARLAPYLVVADAGEG